jgi:hypothetical protein
MTSAPRSFTNPAYIRIRPFYQYPDAVYGWYPPFIGLCHDICTASADGNSTITNGPSGHEHRGAASAFSTAPGGLPHPPPPGMGKADRLGQRVPLPSPHFALTEDSLRHRNSVHESNARTVPLLPPHFPPTQNTFRIGNTT